MVNPLFGRMFYPHILTCLIPNYLTKNLTARSLQTSRHTRTPTLGLNTTTFSPSTTYVLLYLPSFAYPNDDAFPQPIRVGYSYGKMVNNSRDAALDVYDFLLKFFYLHPHLVRHVSYRNFRFTPD